MATLNLTILTDHMCYPGAGDLPDGPALIGECTVGTESYDVLVSSDDVPKGSTDEPVLSIQLIGHEPPHRCYTLWYRQIGRLRKRLQSLPDHFNSYSELQTTYGFKKY